LDDNATVGRGLGVDRVDEDLAVFKPNRGYLVVNFLLTVTGLAVFAFRTMNERRCFVVETVETVG
jgi:hypothetical protein